ncbi:MAG TPA: hypothetical protein VF059_00175 [Casimicrobiaceae bacterium]
MRTQVPWWGRGLAVALLVALVGAMWWWGFDFGRIFGGVKRQEALSRVEALEAANAALAADAARLRARTLQLESEVAMTRGAQEATARQAADLTAENAQLKEEAAFLRQLVAGTNRQPGMSVPAQASVRAAPPAAR